MNKENKSKKIISLGITLFIVMLLVSGGSFAYWTWVTASSERTNVSLTIEAPNMSATLTGHTQNITNLIPISSCTDETYAIKKELTLTYSNLSTNDGEILGTLSIENFVSPYGTPDSEDLSHLHYSVTRTPNNCESGPIVGMNGTFTSTSGNLFVNQKIVELITPGTNEASITFYLLVWLDSEYTHQNVGSGVTNDPMQNISFTLTWSGMINNGLVSTQVPAYISYDKTDNTLRISKGNNDGSASPMNNTSNNAFLPKYTNDLYNVDKIENDNVYFDLENKSYSAEQLPWHEYREEIKKIIIEDQISPKSMNGWFTGMTNLEYMDVSKINTSRITNMRFLFYGVGSGTDVDSFEIVGLEGWNISNVTDMHAMFLYIGENATTWSIGDLSNWDVSNVTTMHIMFGGSGSNATTWDIGDLSNWDVSNVVDMNGMFKDVSKNTMTFDIGNLSSWNVSNVTDMSFMFSSAGQNATIWNIGNLSNWDVSSVTNMQSMFSYTGQNATTWKIGDLSNWDVSKVTNMGFMFYFAGYNATNFSLNLSNWDTSKVTNIGNMFWSVGNKAINCSLNLSNWNLSGITSTSQFFYNTGHDATNFSLNLSGWQFPNVTSMRGMFGNMCNTSSFCEIIGLEGWNVSNVTDMNWMFQGVAPNATIFSMGDISGWNTSNVVDMGRMFWAIGSNATNFSLNLSDWNVDLVTNYEFFNFSSEAKVIPPAWVN